MKWNILNTNKNIDLETCLLQNRNISNIDYFFNPIFDKYLYDPFLFTDMQKAIDRIKKAILNNEKIMIYGDYDVDGITAATILKKAFDIINYQNVFIYLPHRLYDGYGLSIDIIDKFYNENIKLIITVDCGISNIEEINLANKYNIDVIITDHHSISNIIPNAYAIIHPYFGYPFLYLAGVGIAYKLAHALLMQYLSDIELEKFLKWNLDIVTIGTIADIQILQDENRLFVKNGLITLNKTRNIGLQQLIKISSINKDIDIYEIGFILAPKLNASGRIDDPYIAFKLLNTNNINEAQILAQKLYLLNNQRQNLLKKMLDEAIQQIDKTNIPKLLILKKEDWHHGIIGLVSGKICDMFYRPTITFEKRDDIYIGSARSIPQYNIIQAISEFKDLLIKYGGHASAAGFSIHKSNFEEFCKLISNHCNTQINNDLEPILDIECYLNSNNINLNIFNIIDKFKPFGEGNKEPIFAISGTLININTVGNENNHIKMLIKIDNTIIDAIWFDFKKDKIKNKNIGDNIECAVKLIKDTWNNNISVKFKVIDVK